MRYKDENKVKRIEQAVVKVILKDGYQNLSIDGIAKAATVSPATIYLYFKDKQDVLGQTYLSLKQHFDQELYDGVTTNQSVELKLRLILKNFATATLNSPDEAMVMNVFHNHPELISENDYQKGMEQAQIIKDLYSEEEKQQVFRKFSDAVFISFTFQPLQYLLDSQRVTPEEITNVIEMAWQAVKN